MLHDCRHYFYRCQYEERGKIWCVYGPEGKGPVIVDDAPELCGVCGEQTTITGRTKNGRMIRSCGDASPYPNAVFQGQKAGP